MARRYVDAEGPDTDATRKTIAFVFATLHRLFGVGIGEHLGYLPTGLWTVLVSVSVPSTSVIWPWLGWIGLPIGAALLIGSLEFVRTKGLDGPLPTPSSLSRIYCLVLMACGHRHWVDVVTRSITPRNDEFGFVEGLEQTA